MEKVVSDMLLDIAHERSGYTIGEPWRFTEHSLAAVVPLVRDSQERQRDYRLFSERKDEVRVTDTGNIERLTLVSKSEFPILMKTGEILVGGTQSRTITTSQVLMPGEKLIVPCACVHSSKGIREGQSMTPDAFGPIEVRRRVLRGHYSDRGGRAWGSMTPDYSRDQGEIWAGVKEYSAGSLRRLRCLSAYAAIHPDPDFGSLREANLTYHKSSDDLAGRVAESQSKYQDVLKKVPKVESQIGMALLTMTGLESMEAFEHTDSWEAVRKAILGADADKISDISDQNGLFEFKGEKAKEIIQGLLTSSFDEKVAVDRGRTKTLILDAERFAGEMVILDDAPIHLTLVRKDS